MATPPFLPDETKPGASDLISLFPSVEQTFRDVIEDWILVQHNTTGTHKQVTLDDISEPTIAADLVGIWHESGVLKTRFAGGTVYDLVTSNTGLLLTGGTLTGDLVLAGVPDADLKAATKKYVDDADALLATLADPVLTGNPTAPTPSAGDNDQSIATTAFVTTEIAAIPGITTYSVQTTTSGTSKVFGSIPAGTNRITFTFDRVSFGTADNFLLQIGDAGGIEIADYEASAENRGGGGSRTDGFVLLRNDSDTTFSGSIVLVRFDSSDTWVSAGALSSVGIVNSSSGAKTLSEELTQIRVKGIDGEAFDAGNVTIFTEV